MSRDINGNYTLPPGNPVVPGTIITAAWANSTMSNIGTALTDSLSRTGLGGMTAPLRGIDGAVGAPTFSFTNEPTSGLYRKAANEFWFSVGGVDTFCVKDGEIDVGAGVTTPWATSAEVALLSGSNRNRIGCNGAFRSDQVKEGDSAYVCTSAGGALSGINPTVDGWSCGILNSFGQLSVTQVVNPDAANEFALKVQCTTTDGVHQASSRHFLRTFVRGFDAADFAAGTASPQDITISFWMKSTVAGIYGVRVINNSLFNRNYIATVEQLVANTWEYKTITLTMDGIAGAGFWFYVSGVGMYLDICLASGTGGETATPETWQTSAQTTVAGQVDFMNNTSNILYLKQVQIEKGSVPTAFENISSLDDLQRCQMYQWKTYSRNTVLGTVTYNGAMVAGSFGASGAVFIPIRFPVTMAAPPVSVFAYSPATGAVGKWVDGALADQNVTMQNVGSTGCMGFINTGNLTACHGHVYASCRLGYDAYHI